MKEIIEKDRISKLPEHLRCEILNHLFTHEAAATTILSRSWKNLWLTLPHLRLANSFFHKSIKHTPNISNEQLLNSVDHLLTRLSKCSVRHNYITLEKLTLHIPTFDLNLMIYDVPKSLICIVNDLLVRAVNEFRVKKLDFSVGQSYDYYCYEPKFEGTHLPIFSLGSWKQENITDLKLRGCMLTLSCFETRWCTLRCLSLRLVTVNQGVLDSITRNCNLLEFLQLRHIRSESEMDTLHASCLKRLVTLRIYLTEIKKIELDNPTLEHFEFVNLSILVVEPCTIHNLASSKGLIVLDISNAIITDNELLMINFAHFSKLRKLFLIECLGFKSVRISNRFLNSLKLCTSYTYPLEELEIMDAPALQNLQVWPHIRRIKLHLNWYHQNEHSDAFEYEKLVKFLGTFHVAGEAVLNHLEVQFTESLPSDVISYYVVPPHIRHSLSCSPLYGGKNLKINYFARSWKEDDKFEGLIDGLLWLSRPKTITIKLYQQRGEIMVDSKELKFEYAEDDDKSKCDHCKPHPVRCLQHCREKCHSCKRIPYRCWRHYLREVTIMNKLDQRTPITSKHDDEAVQFFNTATMSRNVKIKICGDVS